MPTGTVKYVDAKGQWGFISRDDKQPKVFLSLDTVLRAGHTEIRKNQRWSFDLAKGRDGRPQADNLLLLMDG